MRLLLLLFSFKVVASAPKIVIDQDGGADDAIATFLALLYEKHYKGIEILALTTTHGNVNESQVFINTQKFLNIANRKDVPVYRGSQCALVQEFESDYYYGIDGLGDSDEYSEFEPIEARSGHAVLALIEMSKRFPGELIVVALGPLTNIALAISLDPEFINRLQHLYIAGSNLHNENFKEAEFNAIMDVESYHIVLKSGRRDIITLVSPSQVAASFNLTREWRTSTLGSIPTEIMTALNVFERQSIAKEANWTPLDPVAMAIVLDEIHMIEESRFVHNDISFCDYRGTNFNNFISEEACNARLVYKINQATYVKMLLKIFSEDMKHTSHRVH